MPHQSNSHFSHINLSPTSHQQLIDEAQTVGKVSTFVGTRQGELSTSSSAKNQCHGATTAQHQDSSASTPAPLRASVGQPQAINDACVVCMEAFVMTDELHVLPCKHYFHDACTNTWLQVGHATSSFVLPLLLPWLPIPTLAASCALSQPCQLRLVNVISYHAPYLTIYDAQDHNSCPLCKTKVEATP